MLRAVGISRFPVDTLKNDRSFVNRVIDDKNDATIAKTIVALGKNLDLRVVAEGVETEAQLDFLRQQGCQEAQGYLISKPRPADEFAAWYRENAHCLAAANRVAASDNSSARSFQKRAVS